MNSYGTPRTDAVAPTLNLSHQDMRSTAWSLRDLCRELERELAAMTRDRDARAREACTLEGRTGCSYASPTPEHGDGWIPFSGPNFRLPQSRRMVLVAVKDSHIGPVAYAFFDGSIREFQYMVAGGSYCPITKNMGVGEVTHWRELPTPPATSLPAQEPK